MKKVYLLATTILMVTVTFADALKPIAKRISELKLGMQPFENAGLFEVTPASSQVGVQLSGKVSHATVMEFRKQDVQKILSSKPGNLNFMIPLSSGEVVELELFRSDIFTPDFSVIASSNGSAVATEVSLHYRGIIKGDNLSIAAISIFKDEVMGMISSPAKGNMILGRLEHSAQDMHIFYSERNLSALPNTICATQDDQDDELPGQFRATSEALVSSNCIRLYWEANYDLYQNKGSVTAVTNYLTGLFNQSSTLYANDAIPVLLSQIYVWNTASPYTGTSTSTLLSQFKANRNSFNGDLGHLIGLAGNGGVAAGVNGLCNSNLDYSQCYSGISTAYNNVPTYSWTVEVVTHEQGHLMGSRHTHACVWNGNNTAIDACGPTAGYAYEGGCTGASVPANGGTIMSYCHLTSAGINFSNGFGSQPANAILAKFNNATCLSSCSGATCNMPSGMSTTSVTTSSAVFNWTAVSGAVSYIARYRVTGSANWTTINASTNSIAVSSLTASTNYEWQVQTVCSGGSSSFTSSTTLTTLSSPCNSPAGMNTTSITTSSATLNWTAVSGALSYSVQYRISGTSTWTTAGVVSASYNATGLSAGSQYEWQVQTICSGGSSSFTSSTLFATALPPCNAPTGLSAGTITAASAVLSWTAVSGASSYNVQWKTTASANWSTISGITTPTYNLGTLSACTSYQFQVQTVCSGGSGGFSGAYSFSTIGCSVTYCVSKGNVSTYEYINNVTLGTINNTSGDNTGYADFTGLSANLSGGTSYTIGLTPGFHGSAYREYWTVWIDYNHNGTFTDAGEKVTMTNGTGAVSASFSVPAAALNGATRMRIQMQYYSQQNNSCAAYTYGEVEDYKVVISGNALRHTAPQTGIENPLTENLSNILLFPNPVKDKLNVKSTTAENGIIRFYVHDILGNQVVFSENEVDKGMNINILNTSGLVSGIYILEMEKNGEVMRQKFMISR